MDYQNIINEFAVACKEIFEENLTGVYLHGSMAMGCFNPRKSDIDILVIVKDDISDEQKTQFMERVVKMNESAPKKGLEMSVVKEKYCNPFVYPTPFELHFSPMHLAWFREKPEDYVAKMKGTDKDLAAHFMITGRYGMVLCGKPVNAVFGAVPKEDYIDSIYGDIENAPKDILDDGVYMTLNLCRVLAFLRDNVCLSKEQGGRWGLERLPEKYHAMVESALNCYLTDCEYAMDEVKAKAYAEYMLEQINKLLPRRN